MSENLQFPGSFRENITVIQTSHLGQIVDSRFIIYNSRSDLSGHIMFPGRSRIICILEEMSPGLDLYDLQIDPAQHILPVGYYLQLVEK